MNIFVLDPSPKKSAQLMCDKHIPKMVLESAQMLVCVMDRYGWRTDNMPLTKSGTPYKLTHKKHPCTLWAGETRENMRWLIEHAEELCREYERRFGRSHACEEAIKHAALQLETMGPKAKRLTPFAIAISQDARCRRLRDWEGLTAHQKYQAYYALDKDFARWTRSERGTPEFMNKYIDNPQS